MIRNKLGKSIVGERNILLINSTKNRVSLYDKDNRKLLCKHSFVYEKLVNHLEGVSEILNVCPKCIEAKHERDENGENNTSDPTKKPKRGEEEEEEIDLTKTSDEEEIDSGETSDEEGGEEGGDNEEIELGGSHETSSLDERGEDDDPDLELPWWLHDEVEKHYSFTNWKEGKPLCLEVRKAVYGWGMFVGSYFKEDELEKIYNHYKDIPFGIYKGRVIWDFDEKEESKSDSVIEVGIGCQRLWIDGRKDKTTSYWVALINHKWDWPYSIGDIEYKNYCQFFSNVKLNGPGDVILTRILKANEEVGWDYGMEYWGFKETREEKNKSDKPIKDKKLKPSWNFSKEGINIEFENFIKSNPELVDLALISEFGPISNDFGEFINNEEKRERNGERKKERERRAILKGLNKSNFI